MTSRVCCRCGEKHPIDFFNKDRSREDGIYPQCKNCSRASCRKVFRKYHKKHLGLKQRWKDENRDAHRQINRAWQIANPDKVRQGTADYRARLKRATPDWADTELINLIRSECPTGMHVDHIYPLNGYNSCGLNVPWNLQYLPADVHFKKGRKLPAQPALVDGGYYNV